MEKAEELFIEPSLINDKDDYVFQCMQCFNDNKIMKIKVKYLYNLKNLINSNRQNIGMTNFNIANTIHLIKCECCSLNYKLAF